MMDGFSEYIDVIVQAPVAIITLVFIYYMYKQQSIITSKLADIAEKLIDLINKIGLK